MQSASFNEEPHGKMLGVWSGSTVPKVKCREWKRYAVRAHAIAFADYPKALVQVSKQSSAITHHDPRCTYGCAILNSTIAEYLRGADSPLETVLERIQQDTPDELVDALRVVPDGTNNAQLQTSGYVVHTLQTAFYDALTADTAKDAIVTAVNRGGDTDTLGAVTGALAGARFGNESFPERWLDTIDYRDDLEDLARELIMMDITAPI
jgi:ADP-ribosylglycohydrolase